MNLRVLTFYDAKVRIIFDINKKKWRIVVFRDRCAVSALRCFKVLALAGRAVLIAPEGAVLKVGGRGYKARDGRGALISVL